MIYLFIYLILNVGFGAFYIGMQAGEGDPLRVNRLREFAVIVALLLFGCIIFLLVGALEILEQINNTLQLKFWWQYFFTKEFYEVDSNRLKYLNQMAGWKKEKKGISNRIFCYGVNLINKRNSYIPQQNETR